ncbi:thioredoxin family protein [Litoribaculum gwangyangense]|uniref:Thioredoxin family protein n=1 Tax=Litoribaculum gwangyangense TaxID=1130722 RepID=A0ABP9C841_9FLAO
MIDPIIKSSIKKGISYESYRNMISHLAEINSTTGHNKSEALINYTKLNDRRMKRWDKTIKISEKIQKKVTALNKKITWIIITESWCGDAAHVMPVLNKMAEFNNNISIKIVLRDENIELMDMFLTNGGRAIAKVIMVDDETGEILNTYGPRPSIANKLVNEYKNNHGKLTPEFKEELQIWYNKDKGQTIAEDVANILFDIEFTVYQ